MTIERILSLVETSGDRASGSRDGAYDPATILPRLLAIDPGAAGDRTPEGRRRVLRLLARALRSERRRGRSGHWSYSLNRHAALLAAWKAERRGEG